MAKRKSSLNANPSGHRRCLDRVRALCLSFPEASEVSQWHHPVFRVRRKGFVAFEEVKERPSIAFRLEPLDVERLLERKSTFFATPYGRGLWVSVWVDRALNEKLLEKLARQSYRLMAGKRLTALMEATLGPGHSKPFSQGPDGNSSQ
jgi:predicted DNA-binding protein (MmcQ/YjbR family)